MVTACIGQNSQIEHGEWVWLDDIQHSKHFHKWIFSVVHDSPGDIKDCAYLWFHDRTTRSATMNMLYIAPTRLKLCEKEFEYIGPNIWNTIPINIRSIESSSEFKNEIKNHKFE